MTCTKEVRLFALSSIILFLLISVANAKPVTQEVAQQAAKAFLLKEQVAPPKIAAGPKGALAFQNLSTVLTTRNIRKIMDERGKVLAYVQELEPEGFVIIAPDDRISPVLGYSYKGIWPDDTRNVPLVDLVRWDMEGRLAALDADPQAFKTITEENKTHWNVIEGKNVFLEPADSEISNIWGNWITTEWYQSGRYNDSCPYVDPHNPGFRRPVGCVATAMAQVINYWKYPKRVWFPSVDFPNGCRYASNGIEFDADAAAFGFPMFSQLETSLSAIHYDDNDDEVADLCFGAGIWLRMSYGVHGSGAYMYDPIPRALTQGFGYGSAVPNRSWDESRPYVITNIKSARPVIIGIHKSTGWDGHAVIVDGYQDSYEFFHLNFGWGNSNPLNPWYSLPQSYGSYDSINAVIYDIVPKSGWPQYGANEQNTFSSIFRAPTENPPRAKWQISTASLGSHRFSGIVVGPGNKIYVAYSPKILNDTYHPGVSIYNQFGTWEGSYYLTSETNGIDNPVVDSKWQVFVATDEGGVYRIDTVNKSTVKIFQEPYGEELYSPKIDSDDLIYVNTDNHLYCLTTEGTQLWSFTPLGGNKILGRLPSVDVSRGNVYMGYYDPSANESYLGCINRETGLLRYEKVFSGISDPSRITSASIAKDGTVFFGCYTNIYALTPGTNSFSEKWSIPENFSGNTVAPAVGLDGTVYIGYWEQVSGIWRYAFAAFDPENGVENWKRTFSMGASDGGRQPYVASNGVVLVPITRVQPGSDHFELYAYQDNGNSSTLLWQKNYGGESGADLAFGAGDTLYVLPSSTGSTIYALSQGEHGNPYQASMGFTDNSPPSIPSLASPTEGSGDQSASSVQLSWDCSDPDGNDLKYDIYACALVTGEDAALVPVATQLTDKSYTLTNLQAGTKYLWSVVATDGQAITQGPTWSFSTLGGQIELNPGWNLISFCTQPADPSIQTVLNSISIKYLSVWSFKNNSWQVYDPANPGFSDLGTMEAGWGYWVNMTDAATLTVTGSEPSKSIDLIAGWNLVGYNSATAQPIADALASIAGKYVSVWAFSNGTWKVYDPANPGFSDLTTMDPNCGYWLNVTDACTWNLP